MGSVDFYQEAEGSSPEEAFNNALQQARWEHGHGGYTGSIAEKDSFVTMGTASTMEKAYELAYDLLDDPKVDDKWGPAGVIRIENTNRYLFFGWASS